jgi:glycosidase
MTHPGAPMIYYGDEVGMYGADDPTNRKPMLWKDLEPYELVEDTVDTAQLDWYRRVIALRSAHSALRTGSFSTVLVDDARDLWGWLREDGAERLLVVVNGSDRVQAAESDAAFRERVAGAWDLVFDSDPTVKGATIDGMSIPALGARVWRQSR